MEQLIEAARNSADYELLIYHRDRTKPGGAIAFGIDFLASPGLVGFVGKP